MTDEQMNELTCGHCGKVDRGVRRRYSFGIYAGRLCLSCCRGYRDNCGVGQPQGDPRDLDEAYDEEG